MRIIFVGSKINDDNTYQIDLLLDDEGNFIQSEDVSKLKGEDIELMTTLWLENYKTTQEDFDRFYVINDGGFTVSTGKENELFRHYDLGQAKYGVRIRVKAGELGKKEMLTKTVNTIIQDKKSNGELELDMIDIDFEVQNVGKLSLGFTVDEYEQLTNLYLNSNDEERINIIKKLDTNKEEIFYKEKVLELNKIKDAIELQKELVNINEYIDSVDYLKIADSIENLSGSEKVNILGELLTSYVEISKQKVLDGGEV